MAGLATAALGGESAGRSSAATPDGVSRGAGTPGRGAPGARAADVPDDALVRAAAGAEVSPLGAFTDSGADGVANLAGLQNWLGGTPVRVAHTYLPGDSWDSIEGGDLLEPWAQWKRAEAGRMFVLNVPMQERNEDHLSDDQVRALIEEGAQGADDVHFTRLAQRLVALGVPDTVIVLGWEMNGTTYSHRCAPDPADWKTYWNRIVAAMRAVPGQHFRFDFAPSRGQDAIAWTECYPGDATVDVIGMDSYDQPGGESFAEQVSEPYGLQEQVDFAAAHKKAISYPEWGLFQNGDNPDYMSLMLAWIAAHKPLYQTISDYCPHGVWQCRDNPRASGVYRAVLYGKKSALPAAPPGKASTASPATPRPTATAPPASSVKPAVPVKPAASVARAVPVPLPAAAPSPDATAGGGDETCTPMRLTAEMRQRYASGEVCVTLRPKPATSG
ncbi:glycosyl hydrolase family 26 [Streptomyces sp. PLK6-54]|uniref:Glycosyl hydrolase family 26 n=2 Tax=Actinacidiphila acidipaludis TaxID=2873382 RepID=A0ABS7Q6D0_9ACTN|nr:glycosyl hydrolase family 26 [Streptomyces acidipaludis]